MAQSSGKGLFRPRNVLGTALVAGIGLGIYLAPYLKGWGLGGGDGKPAGKDGQGTEMSASIAKNEDAVTSDSSNVKLPEEVSGAVKVVIDDRTYLLRQANEDSPVELPHLIKLVKRATGDSDGFKLRIYEKASARVSAEEALKDALIKAEIPDTVVFWVPNPVK